MASAAATVPGGNGGGSPDFGAPNGSGLQGYFYDLKQTPDHQSTNMDEDGMNATIRRFCHEGWNQDEFATRYLRSPKPLYTNQILVPIMFSEEGPKAFGMDGICQPGYWVAIYHLKFSPSRTGYFRLAGYGDDFLIAQINGNAVLDSGWYGRVTAAQATKKYNPTWAPGNIQELRNKDGKTSIIRRSWETNSTWLPAIRSPSTC